MPFDRPHIVGPALIVALALVGSAAFGAQSGAAPPDPYVDKGACPFECCTYRDWTTTKPITLLDKPGGSKRIASVKAGVVVRGVTGQVISKPRRMVAKTAYSNTPIRPGDVFYYIHYSGEGFSRVWFKGKTYDAELDGSGVTVEGPPSDDAAWWVNIRTLNGKSGWVLNSDQFENQDACG